MDNKFDRIVKCPKCGEGYSHFAGKPEEGSYGNNGDWRIPMKCEANEHRYHVVLSEHKGNIFIWTDSETRSYESFPIDIINYDEF